ncbi:MAG: glycosyltransferase family 2 protein [Acidimicrobiia bacterium]|nr:glycosyltransferase family 2 protein [Acidimicrobiia bacterium]
MRTVVVVPAFNEQDTVGEVVKRIAAAGLPAVVVDDGSTDSTVIEAEAAGARVLRLPVNIGVGGALRTGFAYAVGRGFERVVQVDADLQHDPALIPVLLEAADHTGAELMIGSRFAAGDYAVSGVRRALMRMLARLVSRTVGSELDDVTSGFRVISQPLLRRFAVDYPTEYLGDTVEAILLAHKHGAAVAQVPVEMAPRSSGSSVSRVHAAGQLARVLFAMAVRSWGRNPS